MRKLVIDVGGKDYAFALDRKEIKFAERLGFNLQAFNESPVSQMLTLWYAGLHKFQPKVSQNEAEELYDNYISEGGDAQEVIAFLSGEYADFLQTIQPDTAKKKARIEEV